MIKKIFKTAKITNNNGLVPLSTNIELNQNNEIVVIQ